ncbi:MAG: type II toxin-antitoxin system HicB family antitoxin [Proteobacteria bacterium]|nr:MAG: type II toxin-antitoxin system HicB family antitoxin [Pseudomonadota bacterium]QKK11131.1 MAG: type II toxin-antitoxin system HicB family antitoxin [Pseudomonadota bacterium]
MIKVLRICVRIHVEPDGEEFYAYCPDLKGVHVGGTTEDEAIENVKHAAEAYIVSLLKHGEPLPLCVEKFSFKTWFFQPIESLFHKKGFSRIEELSVAT